MEPPKWQKSGKGNREGNFSLIKINQANPGKNGGYQIKIVEPGFSSKVKGEGYFRLVRHDIYMIRGHVKGLPLQRKRYNKLTVVVDRISVDETMICCYVLYSVFLEM